MFVTVIPESYSVKNSPIPFRFYIFLRARIKGNCSLLETPDSLIMIDCGISRKKFCVGLKVNVNRNRARSYHFVHTRTPTTRLTVFR